MIHVKFTKIVAIMLLVALSESCRDSQERSFDTALSTEVKVDAQPLLAQVKRVRQALDFLGSPLSKETQAALDRAARETDEAVIVQAIQKALDPYCLIEVHISPETRVKVLQGAAKPELVENGWRQLLVKVHNRSGVTAELRVENFEWPTETSIIEDSIHVSPQKELLNPWLDLQMFNRQPLKKHLSGLRLQYAIIQLYSRDAGMREAKLSFNVGQGTQDIGFRNETDILFTCIASAPITFRVLDEEGKPTTAMFVIRDGLGRVYPSQAKRSAPDFWFHPQVYRTDGEGVNLPPGEYTFEVTRGPEYVVQTRTVSISREPQTITFGLERWVDPSKLGWWSGDHHIHAAGCDHYMIPALGVLPRDMIRHCMGEDLKVGCTLTWGPCFDYQKQFFTGKVDKVSKYPNLLRYDIEVSGFGSHESGHLCLLRLKEQIPPGGNSKHHWPTLCLNTLRWAKKQGAVCGPAHSGWGLEVKTDKLPNYVIPPYSDIGANEYIVDVTHEVPGPDGKPVPAVDFMSMVDTPYVWELNMWYHTLNCGFRTRISGETDFPCIYQERVGMGRSYVKVDGKLDFNVWCEGIRQGRNYVSDGKSHLMDFQVEDVAVGEMGSELHLQESAAVHLTAKVAALLNEEPMPEFKYLPYDKKPYWHIERARIEGSREVPVEVVVNGYPVAKKIIVADGRMRDISFDIEIERSSWIALRILPSSHTNPIFVLVGGKPIRGSRRSAEWCLKGVDQCWSQKERFIDANEMEDAKKAYDHARRTYQKILNECEAI